MTKPEMQSFVFEYQLQRTPAKVWRALTEPALLARWLMKNDIVAEVGHRFQFRSDPMPHWDGIVNCEVLEVVVDKRLAYSWKGGTLDTVVTWTLTPTAGGTLLKLEHTGFTARDVFAYEGMSKGWSGKIAEQLKEVVAGLA